MIRELATGAALLLMAVPALAQTGTDPHAGHDMSAAPAPAQAPAGASAASLAYMAAMDRMSEGMHAGPMTGDAGIDYARMMIPHHQSAIDMAEAYLGSGENDPTLTRLSQDIVRSQQAEIAELRQWLDANPPKP